MYSTQEVTVTGVDDSDIDGHEEYEISLSAADVLMDDPEVETFAGIVLSQGSTDGTGTAVRFGLPNGITSDGTNLYVTNRYNHAIRKMVISTGEVTTLAGVDIDTDETVTYWDTEGCINGTGTSARFTWPQEITIDGTYLYVADRYCSSIRKIEISTGVVTTLVGPGYMDPATESTLLIQPHGITSDGT